MNCRPHKNTPGSFICPICRLVVHEPIELSCSHVFCDSCINLWLHEHNTCPVDKLITDELTSEPLSGLSLRLLRESTVRCRYGPLMDTPEPEEDCCLWAGEYSNAQAHAQACGFRKERCKDCKELVRCKDKGDHEGKCPQATVECEMCREKIKRADMAGHESLAVAKHLAMVRQELVGLRALVSNKRKRQEDLAWVEERKFGRPNTGYSGIVIANDTATLYASVADRPDELHVFTTTGEFVSCVQLPHALTADLWTVGSGMLVARDPRNERVVFGVDLKDPRVGEGRKWQTTLDVPVVAIGQAPGAQACVVLGDFHRAGHTIVALSMKDGRVAARSASGKFSAVRPVAVAEDAGERTFVASTNRQLLVFHKGKNEQCMRMAKNFKRFAVGKDSIVGVFKNSVYFADQQRPSDAHIVELDGATGVVASASSGQFFVSSAKSGISVFSSNTL